MNMSNITIPATTVTRKGQVTIPVEVREHLGIKPTDRVRFAIEADGSVTVVPARSHVLESFGAVKPLRQPEDFRALRAEFEKGVAEDALRSG